MCIPVTSLQSGSDCVLSVHLLIDGQNLLVREPQQTGVFWFAHGGDFGLLKTALIVALHFQSESSLPVPPGAVHLSVDLGGVEMVPFVDDSM